MWERNIPHIPPTGTWPKAQAHALDRNPTGNLLVHRLPLNQLSHTSQGENMFINFRERGRGGGERERERKREREAKRKGKCEGKREKEKHLHEGERETYVRKT